MRKRNVKSTLVKIAAGWLSAVMLMTAIPFPAVNVRAETVSDATDTTKPVYVQFSLESSTTDYNQYSVSVCNNSGQTICDWEVSVQFSADPGYNAGWNGVSYDSATRLMKIQTYGESSWNNATIYDGQSGSGAGFQIDAGMLDSATVTLTYSSGESTGGPATGNEEDSGGGGTSTSDTETNTDLDVEFNYAKLLQQSLYFYDANMCGTLEDTCGVSWRGNCHTYDSNVIYTSGGVSYQVDASGGFHDAGDHVKFGLPQGYAASVLGMSYYQFKDAFDELDQDTHLQTITDYFCDYFKRCTVYKQGSEDEVIAFCYQVGNGDTDHSIWTAPESQTLERPAYFADASNPATDQVSMAVAALALNYMNFGDEEDLKVAKDLFAFVQKNSLACATEGCEDYYKSSSYGDDYATAAAALYVATGKTDNTYLNVYNTYKDANSNGINEYWVMDWANSGALAAMLMGETSKLSNITKAGQSGTKLDNVFWCLSDWGSCRYNSATQFVGLTYDKLASANLYTDWATSQMNYMIGDNPSKRCYAVGYNENSSQYPHHRAASRSTDAGLIVENHYTLLGALVGGPGSNGTYKDAQDDYYCNEVALDYNAGYVGALAGLYLAHKNDTSVYLSYAGKTTDNYGVSLSTQEELSEVGVTTYYGQDEDEPAEDPDPANLTSSVASLVCPEPEYGYTEAGSASSTIANTGQVQTTPSSIALEAGNSFEIVSPSGNVVISPSGTCTLEVRPKKGLSAGDYEDVVVITYDGKTLRIPVSVTVRKKNISNVNFPSAADLLVGQKLSESVLTGGDTQYGTFAWADGSVVLQKGNTACDVVLTLNDNAKANYTFAGVDGYDGVGTITGSVSVNVIRADLPKISFPEATNITYGQTLADSQLVGGSTEYGSFRWEDSAYKPGENEVGTIQKNVIFTWSDACVSEYALEESELVQKRSVSLVVEKAGQTKGPATPKLLSRSANAISVVGSDAEEYSLDGVNWQATSGFEGLTEFTKYKIFARYKETTTHKAGVACEKPLTVYTLVADPYTIDVSKLAESNYADYVDALRTSYGSEPTVTYADGVLTLTGENVTYTLTGSNEKLKVKVISDTASLVVSQGTTIGEVEKPVTEDVTDTPEDKTDDIISNKKIVITGSTKKVAPGKKLKLTAKLYPASVAPQKILWKVSNKKYASVSQAGVVKAKKAGKGKKVYVTAYLEKDNSVLAVYKISIMKKAVKKIKLTAKTTTLKVGKKMKLKAKFTPAKGISKEVSWTSSNPKVATVNAKGKVTAKKKGTVKIIAKAKDGSGKKAVIKIRVK